MIPSTTNRLLVAEDWTKIYQSYRNADFKSYDFETLRRAMFSYLQENYPEDFNDYIDSSEYVALIDLIAFLGQNLSFRIDLNARENFLETAQRRDSILRLAQLVGYNAKRNVPASGFLKIVSVSTDDTVIDTNGTNLANSTISWNDPTNTNWYQQFIAVLNNSMPSSFVFGRPYDLATISGIEHQQYKINSANTNVPVYSFGSTVGGTQINFEVVSSLFTNKTYVYEEPPLPAGLFSYIYKNDNQGYGSSNSGFFVHFRQGALSSINFAVENGLPNQIIGIDAPDINNSDVWLWKLNAAGNHSDLWTQVNSLVGNNIIYNSLEADVRDIYAVSTRDNDQIDLNFADGSFGNLPKGKFIAYYRQSNGLSYVIKPQQLSNISLTIPYINKNGQTANLRMVLSLQETVSNSSGRETDAQIKLKAPQNYYVQNRMITAEDYNIAPLVAGTDILKIKSINRISSGVSKYFDLSDVSGQYSNTNIFADDGILYKDLSQNNFEFTFINENEILGMVVNQLSPVIASMEMRNFYLEEYPRVLVDDAIFIWNLGQKTTNQTNGYFSTVTGPAATGNYSNNTIKYVKPGALVKFVPPAGYYFLPNNELTTIADETTKEYIWSKVVAVIGDGYNSGLGLLDSGAGPVTMTGNIPASAIAQQIIPKFSTTLSSSLVSQITNTCAAYRNFGLSFDANTREWYIIIDSNLNLVDAFGLGFQKDTLNLNKDNSWLVAFEWTGINYRVTYRYLDYIFESIEQTSFFVDKSIKNYDFVNDTVIKDQIRILSINDVPTHSVKITTSTYSGPIALSTLTSVTLSKSGIAYATNVKVVGSTVTSITTTTAVSPITVRMQSTASFTSTTIQVPTTQAGPVASNTAGWWLVHTSISDRGPNPAYWTGITESGFCNIAKVLSTGSYVYGYSTTTFEISGIWNTIVPAQSYVTFVPKTVTTTTVRTVSLVASTASAPAPYTVTMSTITVVSTVTSFTTSSEFTFTQADARQSFSLTKDYPWQVDTAIVEPDGYVNANKIKISFFDYDDDGQIDDPDAFEKIVQPATSSLQTGYQDKFVFFKLLSDGLRYEYVEENIFSYPTEPDVPAPIHGQLYYFYNPNINVVKEYDEVTLTYITRTEYFVYYGRSKIKFHYLHNSGQERRIDPGKSNLIDIYLLTKSYDTEYRNWLTTRVGTAPQEPSSQSLSQAYSGVLEPIKSISDELIFQPTRYKILFGDLANSALQAKFKAVRNSSLSVSDNDLKTKIIIAIGEFFNIDNWSFGQTFHFSELVTYVMNQLTPAITNFIIVPKSVGSFGSLYEVTCQSNEIFISGATVNDIEIIDAVTASQLKTSGSIVTSSSGT